MSVFLIGYRGSGKTTVGRLLAGRLGWGFVDADDRIVARAGRSIREIFEQSGEPVFRQLETEVVAELCGCQRHVLSLGGGAAVQPANRAALAAAGHPTVYLRGEPEELHRRIVNDPFTTDARPNLTAAGGLAEIRAVLVEREPIYRQVMTHELDVTGRAPDELVERICTLLAGS